MKSLGDILNEFSGQRKHKRPIVEARVVNHWPELMGDLVNRYTEKIYIKGNTLFVQVGPDALKNELLYSSEKIISKLNEFVGEQAIDKLVIL